MSSQQQRGCDTQNYPAVLTNREGMPTFPIPAMSRVRARSKTTSQDRPNIQGTLHDRECLAPSPK
jgi:hypothetical protein